jgi:hypothetical protein
LRGVGLSSLSINRDELLEWPKYFLVNGDGHHCKDLPFLPKFSSTSL